MNVVKIFNYRINISIAKPKTIWFTNIRKPNKGINQESRFLNIITKNVP